MPIVHVEMLEGRPPEKLPQLIRALTDTVCQVLDVPPERVRVVITEVPKTLWGIGGVTAADLGR